MAIVLTETDPSGTITYTYNGFGEVLTSRDQMNGVTTNTYDAQWKSAHEDRRPE